MERRTESAAGIHSTRQARTERFCRKLQRAIARRMPECELVHELERCTEKDRRLATRLQPATSAQFVELLATSRVCTSAVGDAGMRKAGTRLPEQGTQAPSPAPDLIPAKTENQPRTYPEIGPLNGGTSVPISERAAL